MSHDRVQRSLPEEAIVERDEVRHPRLSALTDNLLIGLYERERAGDHTHRQPYADLKRFAEQNSLHQTFRISQGLFFYAELYTAQLPGDPIRVEVGSRSVSPVF